MSLTPLQSLILLALVGLAISGWLYGLHWKRIATGDSFTKEEKVMFLLQDQIEVLTKKNQELNTVISKLESELEGETGESPQSSESAPQSEVSKPSQETVPAGTD